MMELESVKRLSKDIKLAAQTLSADEARYLVDTYYQMQRDRIRSDNQVRSLQAAGEPHTTLGWLADNAGILERNIRSALDVYSEAHVTGRWAKSIVGIGPIIAAGLIANIDMSRAPTVGHIWRFAGLDPTMVWSKGQKRPWNASLKTLTWKIGESFVKVSGQEDDVYGHLYLQRKEYEIRRNHAGELAEQAQAKLAKFNIGKTTDAYIWYSGSLTRDAAEQILAAPPEKRAPLTRKLAREPGIGQPMLPPAHIHARAKRWAVKLFLAHFHAVAYRAHFNTDAPKPYVLSQLHHAHEVPCPNWPF